MQPIEEHYYTGWKLVLHWATMIVVSTVLCTLIVFGALCLLWGH